MPSALKTCNMCHVPKSLDAFNTDRRKSGGVQSMCRDCNKEYQRRHYRANKSDYLERNKRVAEENRALVRDIKSNAPCTDCGKSYPHYVMQFDHLADKDFTIANVGHKMSRKRLLDEIAKCEVVCANCHAERTWARRNKA